jgi:hypothetical protein
MVLGPGLMELLLQAVLVLVLAALLVVQGQGLEPPLQMLEKLEQMPGQLEHYRHELLQPVLSG